MENRYRFWCRETAFIYNKCLDRCQRFGEASLPEEKESYSNLTMQDIADADYKHAKWIGRFWSKEYGKISWYLLAEQNMMTETFIWKLSQQKCQDIWTPSCLLSLSTRISMASMSNKCFSKTWIVNGYLIKSDVNNLYNWAV